MPHIHHAVEGGEGLVSWITLRVRVRSGETGWISTLACGWEFRGTQLGSDGGVLVMRELDDTLGLSSVASAPLRDNRRGKNTVHRLDGLFRQSVYGRLAGYEDVDDAERLALDPVMRRIVGGRAVDAHAASASQMGRFETETLALAENQAALADLNGQWIDRFHDRNGLKYIVLDMDSSVSLTHGDQEGADWNGHPDCNCYHPNFLFNQFGMLERCALRNGNVHSADGWRDVLDPVIARYAGRNLGGRFFRVDAAYAISAICARLEEAGYFYAIKIGARVVRHARAITFQLAEMAVTGSMVRAILAAIHRLRAPPSCA